MGNVTVAEFVSLDGIMGDPKWTVPYWNNQLAAFKYAELMASDALLLGRRTYDNFARAWPPREGADGYADRMNSIAKHVVSTTMTSADWNNSTVIRTDIVASVEELKTKSGGDILVFGSGTLVAYLMDHRLVDEYRLLVYPVVLGSGQRLFPEGCRLDLNLVARQLFSSGVMALIYRAVS